MTSEIQAIEELREHERLRRLKYRYARALDDKNWQGLRECFVDDLHFEVPSTGAVQGAEQAVNALRSGFTHFAYTLHECTMPQLELLGQDEAAGLWNIHTLTITNEAMRDTDPEKIHGYGYYLERYRKVSGAWKIARLQLLRTFKDQQPFVRCESPALPTA